MKFNKESDEVYRTTGTLAMITEHDIAFLKSEAAKNERRRVRLCTHPGNNDLLHEMLIIHERDTFVPAHKHNSKSESFHIIEGKLSVFIFDDNGNLIETIPMGEFGTGRVFYYRLSSSNYHSIMPESEFVVFHEVTNGPFDRNDMIIAPWSPSDEDEKTKQLFKKTLWKSIED